MLIQDLLKISIKKIDHAEILTTKRKRKKNNRNQYEMGKEIEHAKQTLFLNWLGINSSFI